MFQAGLPAFPTGSYLMAVHDPNDNDILEDFISIRVAHRGYEWINTQAYRA